MWAEKEEEAAATNVFARFQYSCGHVFHRHSEWVLFWDPSKTPLEECASKVDTRCAPYSFKRTTLGFQRKLCRLFPQFFELEYEEYDYGYETYREEKEEFTPYSGYYSTGNGDAVYAFEGEGPDHTACDSECGYCGRCSY